MFRHLKKTLLASACALSFVSAAAEVMITPTRMVLENNKRSAEFILVNKGDEQGVYRITLENRRMRLDGALEDVEVANPGELYADKVLRYSPRRATLDPGERQTIRVSAVTAGLAPGEYRSHMRIMGAPTSAGRTLSELTETEASDISIELIAIRSLTIPVIVRVGKLGADVTIEDAKITTDEQEEETLFVARLERTGDKSTYGDVQIYVNGQKEPVYFARGIAIYTPNTERDLYLPMPADLASTLKGQTVRIAYVSSDPDQPGTIAEVTTVVK